METDGAPASAAAAEQDLMCRLLEEGRPHTRAPAAAEVGDVPRLASRLAHNSTPAWKTAFRWFYNVTGLVTLACVIKVNTPWSDLNTEQMVFFVLELLLCLTIPVMGYVVTADWDRIEGRGKGTTRSTKYKAYLEYVQEVSRLTGENGHTTLL